MQHEVYTFSEGTEYYCDDYSELVKSFSRYPGLMSMKGNVFSFAITGFLIYNNSPVVIFPKGYKTSDKLFKLDASTLLRVLLKYRLETVHPEDESPYLNGNDTFSNGRIIQAVFLINDYMRYGFLRRTEYRKKTHVSGGIDWNATINTTIPVFSHGAPVYADPVIRTNVYNEDNIIIRIHKAVISECLDLWGWMIASNFDDMKYDMPCSVDEALCLLQAELTATYVNRELDVLRNLISYLQSKTGNNPEKQIELLATPYFYYTWEFICGHVFGNQYSKLSEIVPQPVWKNCPVNHSISQRPDILFVDNNRLFVLDAKYYDYRRSLPGWHDVSKQFFYQYTIEHNTSAKTRRLLSSIQKTYNAFILPENDSDDSVYTGTVEVQNVKDLGCIHSFAINTRKAMTAYAYSVDSSIKEEVVSKIISL